MAKFFFDASKVDPTPDYSAIPAGVYLAMITNTEVKPSKSGMGLSLEHTVINGEFKGRKFFNFINTENRSEKCQNRGQSDLSQLFLALGVIQISDTVQLHNIPVNVKIKITNDPKYGEQNSVVAYEAANPSAAGQVVQVPQSATAPQGKDPFTAQTQKPKSTAPWAQQG